MWWAETAEKKKKKKSLLYLLSIIIWEEVGEDMALMVGKTQLKVNDENDVSRKW